ncbi:MAG TPA: sigma-70 family RNA polymerase sigma factor [Thermoanaerobaculia bacterium]|nr:sigma-70 family RNA polymerase sigma factor [Thermoanaerobaculia bacterium]
MEIIARDDAGFVAALRAGDEDAFETLVRTRTPALLKTARRFLRSEEDARDAVQEAFVLLFRSVERFEGNAQLSTWLHRILVNCCLMKLRTRRRHPEEEIDVEKVERSASPEPADMALQRAELRDVVRASIDRLPDRYRVVVLLRDVEELSTEETARVLDTTAGAVKVRLHHARRALKTILTPVVHAISG